MSKIDKIIFVSFQSIKKGIPSGMVKFLLPLIDCMDRIIQKKIIYYISYVSGYKGPIKIEKLSATYLIIIRFFSLFSKYIYNYPAYKIRYWQEKLFDLFLALKINEPIVIVSSAYLFKALKKNKALGGINILLAGNPDDFEINKLLEKEKDLHDFEFSDAYTYKKRIEFTSKSTSLYDHIVTFTLTEKESYEKRINKKKISFVECHILPDKKNFPAKQIMKRRKIAFCFVAHPFWLKGLPYLLEAWKQIDSENIQLFIAGKISDDLQIFIDNKYNFLKNITYLGWVNDLNAFFRSSHVCIIPSLLDAGPATVAEAMFCGLPVIVSEGCGSRLLVKDGVNGFIVPPGSANLIAEKIKWFVDNSDQIAKMGYSAKDTIIQLEKSEQNMNAAKHLNKIIDKLQRDYS